MRRLLLATIFLPIWACAQFAVEEELLITSITGSAELGRLTFAVNQTGEDPEDVEPVAQNKVYANITDSYDEAAN